MATPDEMAATMLRNLPDKTGKSLSDWHKILKNTAHQKHGQFVRYLKQDHGVTHGFANLIVAKYLEKDTERTVDLVSRQYSGPKTDLRPIYNKLVKAISKFGTDVELAPKKTYVSIRRKKQFALIQPSTKTRVDVGLNLKDIKTQGQLEKSGSFNAMVSHRIKLASVDDIDKQIIDWLREAYDQAS